jgi:hypothetical protein
MVALVGFTGGFYESRSRDFDSQKCINLYPEISESGISKSPLMLVGTPGLKLWRNFGGSDFKIRGMMEFNTNILIVVAGATVYRMDQNAGAESIGTVDDNGLPVYMASNGQQVFLSSAGKGYQVNPVAGTTTLLTLPSTGVGMVWFLDGSFLFNEPGTGKFWGTDLYSFVVDPLSFATAEGSPDNVVGTVVDHREFWLFGDKTTEIWYNNGSTLGFPFARIDGAFIEIGCAAAGSIAKADNSVFWLSADIRGQGMILQAAGYQPVRVSTHAVERKIAEMSRIDDAIAFTYQQEGHTFYQISFPTGNITLVYDVGMQMWHERRFTDLEGRHGRHRANNSVFFGRKNLVGDWGMGNIYQYDLDSFSDAGYPILRLRRTNHITQNNEVIGHSSLIIDVEQGVGTTEGQGEDPKLMMRYSDDGGHKWSNERTVSIGKTGQYGNRVKFTRLGRSRDRIYEISISDPVKVALLGAYLNE